MDNGATAIGASLKLNNSIEEFDLGGNMYNWLCFSYLLGLEKMVALPLLKVFWTTKLCKNWTCDPIALVMRVPLRLQPHWKSKAVVFFMLIK